MIEKSSLERLTQMGIKAPAGWTQSRVKYLGTYMNGYPFKPEDWGTTGRPILRIQDLSGENSEPNRFDGEVPSRYLIRKNDILIPWSASLGVYRWKGEDAWLNQHIFKVTVREALVREDYFVWLAEWFINELAQDVQGSTMQHLTADKFGSFPVLLPPHEIQAAIAEFLERETAAIAKLSEKQAELIARLSELRKSLIARLVCRGVRSTKTLDSRIYWLGHIPSHWRLTPVKRLFNLTVQPAPAGNDLQLLSIYTDIGVRPRKELEERGNKASNTDGYLRVQKNDLIVNKLLAWMGAIGISRYDGVTSPAYDVLRPRADIDSRYYDALFRCGICFTEFRRHSRGIMDMRLRLYFEDFGPLLMPHPPLAEQQEIVAAVECETKRINECVALAETMKLRLEEYRAALVAAAVTGQIDVRTYRSEEKLAAVCQ